MGYDTRPLITLEEKAAFLEKAEAEDYLLFLEHDANTEICNLKMTEKGVRLNETYRFDEIFS